MMEGQSTLSCLQLFVVLGEEDIFLITGNHEKTTERRLVFKKLAEARRRVSDGQSKR
jgi:hypothetical protein